MLHLKVAGHAGDVQAASPMPLCLNVNVDKWCPQMSSNASWMPSSIHLAPPAQLTSSASAGAGVAGGQSKGKESGQGASVGPPDGKAGHTGGGVVG